jgi:hypothetical protein
MGIVEGLHHYNDETTSNFEEMIFIWNIHNTITKQWVFKSGDFIIEFLMS